MSNFLGKLLAKRFRPVDAPNDETKKILDAFYRRCSKYDEALEKLVQKYGAEEAAELWTFTFFKDGFFEVSWECSDCVLLDDHQYFEEKMAQDRTAGPPTCWTSVDAAWRSPDMGRIYYPQDGCPFAGIPGRRSRHELVFCNTAVGTG